MRVFFDTSALAKRYITERGTAQALLWLERADEVLLSVLAPPEVISALTRLRHAGTLSQGEYEERKRGLASDVAHASVLELTSGVLRRAIECMERFPLRASDALHVATALEVEPDRFVSSDRRQCEGARGMGLRVEEIAGDE